MTAKKNTTLRTQDILNAHIFGTLQQLEDTDPREGITHVKIDVNHEGVIPGVIEHWSQDIERRKGNIKSLVEKTFSDWLSSFMKNKKERALHKGKRNAELAEATGEEIYKLYPNQKTREAFERLNKNPADMMTRLELVEIVANSTRDFSIEDCRTLFLQATVAATLGELNNLGLNIVLATQEKYFAKLIKTCHQEIKTIENKLEATRGKNSYRTQAEELKQRMEQIRKNMAIIAHYQRPNKESDRHRLGRGVSLNFAQLEKIVRIEEGSQQEKILIQKASKIMMLLRHMPLLHEEGRRYLQLLTKITPKNALVYFLSAKLSMRDLMFTVEQYKGGYDQPKLAKSISEKFKTTYHQYSLAVQNIGKKPHEKNDFTILIEFANLLHYFYGVAVRLIRVSLPKEWLETAFTKAREALALADDGSGKTGQIFHVITTDMQHAGLVV